MVREELVCKVAMSFLEGIGPIRTSKILSKVGYVDFFTLPLNDIKFLTGLSDNQLCAMRRDLAIEFATREIEACEREQIDPIFIQDQKYPRRLKQCSDAPIILYRRGTATLNPRRIVAVVGSRMNTEYGKDLVKSFVEGISDLDCTVVSGLALGIDSIAHSSSLRFGVKTIAVLGSGLNQIFPQRNYTIAEKILREGGGLISEYSLFSKPVRENFPVRNRIIAGLCDATIVIESRERGGALITAHLANDYNRDVFAFPGSVYQQQSKGCNLLIQNQKAHLITEAKDFIKLMGWEAPKTINRRLAFPDSLNENEQLMVRILCQFESLYLDELAMKSGFSMASLQGILLGLELKGLVVKTAGLKYRSQCSQ